MTVNPYSSRNAVGAFEGRPVGTSAQCVCQTWRNAVQACAVRQCDDRRNLFACIVAQSDAAKCRRGIRPPKAHHLFLRLSSTGGPKGCISVDVPDFCRQRVEPTFASILSRPWRDHDRALNGNLYAAKRCGGDDNALLHSPTTRSLLEDARAQPLGTTPDTHVRQRATRRGVRLPSMRNDIAND